MITTTRSRPLMLAALLGACSASPSINVGDNTDGSVAGSGGTAGFGGVGGFGGGDDTLTALITEPPSEMAIEIITISCAGECKQVLAVATGGNDPYTFSWNDGVTTAAREICVDNDTTFSVTVSDTAIVDGEFPYVAQTVTASVTAHVLDCPSDGGVADAGCAAVIGPQDLVGTATVLVNGPDATAAPAPTMFANGSDLPAGRYRLRYVDGCLMYSFGLGWMVTSSVENGVWLVSRSSNDRVVKAPPTASVATAVFADCVSAARMSAPVDFDFAGGPLGVWLLDSPYIDNVPGENGRNPTYELERLCPAAQGSEP
jgi:hypothetical protein